MLVSYILKVLNMWNLGLHIFKFNVVYGSLWPIFIKMLCHYWNNKLKLSDLIVKFGIIILTLFSRFWANAAGIALGKTNS